MSKRVRVRDKRDGKIYPVSKVLKGCYRVMAPPDGKAMGEGGWILIPKEHAEVLPPCGDPVEKAANKIADEIEADEGLPNPGIDTPGIVGDSDESIKKKKCRFGTDGVCYALACYSNDPCDGRDEKGHPAYISRPGGNHTQMQMNDTQPLPPRGDPDENIKKARQHTSDARTHHQGAFDVSPDDNPDPIAAVLAMNNYDAACKHHESAYITMKARAEVAEKKLAEWHVKYCEAMERAGQVEKERDEVKKLLLEIYGAYHAPEDTDWELWAEKVSVLLRGASKKEGT